MLLRISLGVLGAIWCAAAVADQNPALAASVACEARIKGDPSYAQLGSKIALGSVNEQTFSMLVDSSKPTEQEKAQLVKWVEAKRTCVEILAAADTKGEVRGLLRDSKEKFERAAMRLYSGEISYGEFAKARAELSGDLDKSFRDQLNEQRNRQCEGARKNVQMFCGPANQSPGVQINVGPNAGLNPFSQLQLNPFECGVWQAKARGLCR